MIIADFSNLPSEELLNRAQSKAETRDGEDPDEYFDLVGALHRRPERHVFNRASHWCVSERADERVLGADILGQLGAGDQERPWPFAEESAPILVRLLADPSVRVVGASLIALGRLGAGDPEEIAALAAHPSCDVRYGVASALGGREDPKSLSVLVQQSRDEDRDVRDWATFSLGSLCEVDTPAIREALSLRLADEDREIRGEAMLGLALRGDERAAAAILSELESEDVLMLAVEAAGHLTAPGFLPHLEKLSKEYPEDQDLRAALRLCRQSKA